MKYPPYPHYKESEIEWLGEIPVHWEIVKFSRTVKIQQGQIDPTDPEYSEMILVAPNHVESGTGRLIATETASEQAAESGKYWCAKGSVIYSKIRPALRKATIAQTDCLCSADMYPLDGAPRFLNGYLLWFILSDQFSGWSVLESDRVAMPKINRVTLNELRLPAPLPFEQFVIADFLDSETSRINRLVAKKRNLIKKLEEKRTALISRTVTRGLPPDKAIAAGLNPDPLLKPSGIEWLGEIPAHWRPLRLKHLLQRRKGAIKTGPFGSQLQSIDMMEGEIKVYNQRSVLDRDFSAGENYISIEKFQELRAFEVFPNDLVVTTRGTIGRCAVFPDNAERGILHPCLMRVQADQRQVLNRYLEILVQDSGNVLEQLRIMSNATTIEVIYSESLKEVWLAVPPMTEQIAIIEYLDHKVAMLDDLVFKVQIAIDRLQQYRTALITAAVTGKIDVRDLSSVQKVPAESSSSPEVGTGISRSA